jgi:aldehyde:ferredoxin oxidoreductase
MDIRTKIEQLAKRMHDLPQYPTQGAVLFVDLEQKTFFSRYLPREVIHTVLTNRGANMYLLYNLMLDGKDPLDPQIPLIFGSGALTGTVPTATRGNVSSISPESYAILDSNCGDAFPTFLKFHGYDHLVLYGQAAEWTLLRIAGQEVTFHDAGRYQGMDNSAVTHAVEQDFSCTERKDMAMARITSAGENLNLFAGIMGGVKAIYARGGGGAKMGSLKLKAVMIQGRGEQPSLSQTFKENNRTIAQKILSASVIKNALKTVGTPFLYKPSRILGAMGTKNNQETSWSDSLDADNFDAYRPGMDGCLKCPVRCRPLNDLTPDGKGGWGAAALKGLTGNASYDQAQAAVGHQKSKNYRGINGDDTFDQYDKGDGPEYTTLQKMGPMIGISEPEQVMRLNNILNELGLDSASAGSAISWAMELYQRGIITDKETGGLDLSWGNYPVVEKLLFMSAKREGFGDVIADSNRAVDTGKYPAEALKYRMTIKGLFQSDPHDARILKGFALGLAVATRGMDHLRNRPTLEINAKINENGALKTALYGGIVAPEPTSYEGKEYAVRRCENSYAIGDSVGMCRFSTKLFNSPSTADNDDFAAQLTELTGESFTAAQLDEIGRNISGLERLINARIGLTDKDDTLPDRWFNDEINVGQFAGEKIDREQLEALKLRFYTITGLNTFGVPTLDWHQKLAEAVTGFAVKVDLLGLFPGAPEGAVIVDQPVSTVAGLREALKNRLPHAVTELEDNTLNIVVNGTIVLANEQAVPVKNGDRITVLAMLAGG